MKKRIKKAIKRRVLMNPMSVLLGEIHVGRMSNEERVAMTVSCHDVDYIPKVKDAGKIKTVDGKRVQVLHNGLLVEADGYVGDWMTQIIKTLKGHHEPQEEKAFYEILKRVGKNPTILELGSYWSYYSLWLKKEVKGARAICVEPDPANRDLGVRNAELNGMNDITFLSGAAGSEDGKIASVVLDSEPDKSIDVPILSVDGLVKSQRIKYLDILHMDIQGVELDALHGAIKSIKDNKVRFLFVSTHHYIFSKSPNTHADCIKFITDNGGHIISSHTIHESFSGDGLIVASFSDKDKNFKVETSLNHVDQSLFRTPDEDLRILIDYYQRAIS